MNMNTTDESQQLAISNDYVKNQERQQLAIDTVSKLFGKQWRVLETLQTYCNTRNANTTGPMEMAEVVRVLETNRRCFHSLTLELQRKGLVKRLKGRRGPASYVQFKIPTEVLGALRETQLNRRANRHELAISKPDLPLSSSSINKTTTKAEPESEAPKPRPGWAGVALFSSNGVIDKATGALYEAMQQVPGFGLRELRAVYGRYPGINPQTLISSLLEFRKYLNTPEANSIRFPAAVLMTSLKNHGEWVNVAPAQTTKKDAAVKSVNRSDGKAWCDAAPLTDEEMVEFKAWNATLTPEERRAFSKVEKEGGWQTSALQLYWKETCGLSSSPETQAKVDKIVKGIFKGTFDC